MSKSFATKQNLIQNVENQKYNKAQLIKVREFAIKGNIFTCHRSIASRVEGRLWSTAGGDDHRSSSIQSSTRVEICGLKAVP